MGYSCSCSYVFSGCGALVEGQGLRGGGLAGPYHLGMFLNYLSAIGLKREALLNRRQGACVQGELATGGRALPERTEDCRVCTVHHRSIILFSWVWWVGENSFRGFFELTGEGSGKLPTRSLGGKGEVSRCRPLRSVKDCVLCLARASLRLRTARYPLAKTAQPARRLHHSSCAKRGETDRPWSDR